LYYIFGTLADGKQLIRDEDENPLSEEFVTNNVDKFSLSDENDHNNHHV
jgi:HAE1 family hydrophobic/amphiphilic exporter-1